MSIVFAVRADNASFNARYSSNSTAGALVFGTVTYDVDATAINGHNFNLAQSSLAIRCLSWPFRGCLTSKAVSVLIRLKCATANELFGIWQYGQPYGLNSMGMGLYTNSSLWNLVGWNDAGTGTKNGSFASGGAPSTSAWQDVVITWDGTTSANKIKLWVDGVNVDSATSGGANPNTTSHECISIGGVTVGVPNARFKFEEFVVWNTEIDPTSVTLDSGTGSLNGASRTSLVTVSAFNGGAYTDPGVANVAANQTYTYAGLTKTGTKPPGGAKGLGGGKFGG